MNNKTAQRTLVECLREVRDISLNIDKIGKLTPVALYLTHYAVIRCCGAIEVSFKSILADFSEDKSRIQAKNYIDKRFRDSPLNPSYANIQTSAGNFDENWGKAFKGLIASESDNERLKNSLDSLNKARNDIAHGKGSTVSFDDARKQFWDAWRVILVLDSTVK
jgi:hypothetical protein